MGMVGGNLSKIRVYTAGVWDMLHIGHIEFLKRAKALGDILIVGVQSDEEVEKQKGIKPIICTKDRIATLEALSCVDLAIPYTDFNYISHFVNCNADIFVLSEENREALRFESLRRYMATHGKRIFYLPYDKDVSTTQIKNNIKNFWADTWEKVAQSDKGDHEIVGHNSEVTKKLARYFTDKLEIYFTDIVLDFGCGAGLILKELDCVGFGIDISPSMIGRAIKNYNGIYLVNNHIPLQGSFDHIISFGVLHYLPTIEFVEKVIEEMKSLSKSIMLVEIPDIDKREQRLEHRKRIGKILFPEPLYLSKGFFTSRGFRILDDHPKLTDNSEFSFSVIYDKV